MGSTSSEELIWDRITIFMVRKTAPAISWLWSLRWTGKFSDTSRPTFEPYQGSFLPGLLPGARHSGMYPVLAPAPRFVGHSTSLSCQIPGPANESAGRKVLPRKQITAFLMETLGLPRNRPPLGLVTTMLGGYIKVFLSLFCFHPFCNGKEEEKINDPRRNGLLTCYADRA